MAHKAVILKLEGWSGAMALDLSKIDDDCGVGWYLSEVKADQLDAFGVYHENCRLGSVLTRFEGDEMVIVAGSGCAGFDIIAAVYPVLEDLARRYGCKSVRTHTKRTGLVRKAERQGYVVSEYVLKKVL